MKLTSTGLPAASRSRTDGRARRIRAGRRAGSGAPPRGFSLIEVLAAFVILALVGTSLFRLFSGALGNAGAADDYSRAILVAESALAEAAGQVPLREGALQGTADEGRITWTARVQAYPAAANADAGQAASLMAIRLWQIVADVTFQGGDGKPRAFSLATARIGARDAK